MRSQKGLVKAVHSLLICRLMLLSAFPQDNQVHTTASDQTNPYTLSFNVDLVVLDVTVLDRKGGLVSGLDKKKFKVYENGQPQEIKLFHSEDVPVSIGLVVDNSGSMRSKRLEVIAAALAFVQSSNRQDEMFVVNFNEEVSLDLPLNELFTNNIEQLRGALSKNLASGQTALYDALAVALEHLKKGHHDKKALIVISDGGDNASRHPFQQILMMAKQSSSAIYTIGLYDSENKDQNPKVLKRLSNVSGGEFFFPSSVSDVEGICQRIAKVIRAQYTLGYSPSDITRDGKYRAIQVTVDAPHLGKLSVRTRQGYFAPVNNEGAKAATPERAEPVSAKERS